MNITSAIKNIDIFNNETIKTEIDGEIFFVPVDPANRHYAAIMEQVSAGTLTIAEADNGSN
jgi:hypothetical protein